MSVPIRVLILEDTPEDAELMVRELRRAGFAPEWQRVETEAEYISHLDSALDLILADYSLPRFDAMRALRGVQERGLDIPFIVVTGSISEGVAVECIKQGAADYLLKDRLARLGPAVVQALEQRRLRKEKRKADELLNLQSTVLEATANVIMIADKDGRIAWVNPAFTRLTGYNFQEVWGQNPRILKSGKHDASFYQNLWRTILSGQVWSGEVVNRRKDGSLYTEEMTITPVRDRDGAISHFIGIKQDITERKRAEEALRETSDYLENLITHANAPIIVWDSFFIIKKFNKAFERLTGLAAEEVIGKELNILFPDNSRRQSLDHIMGTQKGERWESVEIPIAHADGGVRTVLWNSATLYRPDGNTVLATIAQGQDITERKQAEEAVRRYVKRLEILRAVDIAILAAESPEAIAKFALQRMRELVPCRQASVVLIDPQAEAATVMATHANAETGAGEGVRLLLEEFGFSDEFMRGKVHLAGDILVHPQLVPMELALQAEGLRSYVRVPLLVRGELIGSLTLGSEVPEGFTPEHVDIAREVADQLALAIQQARLRGAAARRGEELTALLRATRSIMSGLDLQGILERIVEEAAAISGCQHVKLLLVDKPGEVLRTMAVKGTAMSRGDELPLGTGLSGLVAATGQPLFVPDCPRDARNLFADKDREMGLVTYLGLPVTVREEVVGVLTFNTTAAREYGPGELAYLASYADQAAIAIENARLYSTVQQHAAELEQRVQERTHELEAANQRLQDASRHKSEFLANMSHEIRTPLNSIIGFAELLREQGVGPLTERQARYLTHIANAGKHLLQLIGDILDLSKVEAGKFVLQPEPLPVAQTLEDILAIARGLANKKGQTIEVEIAPNLPVLAADPVRFKQILFNLLSNAVKFTPEKGRITLRAYEKAEGREQKAVTTEGPSLPTAYCPLPSLVIEVTDTGVGIKREDLPRLFQEFVQLETTPAQRHEGSGLGLVLTKRLVELHGGRIWAESEGEGRGSTFTVLLPFAGPRT